MLSTTGPPTDTHGVDSVPLRDHLPTHTESIPFHYENLTHYEKIVHYENPLWHGSCYRTECAIRESPTRLHEIK